MTERYAMKCSKRDREICNEVFENETKEDMLELCFDELILCQAFTGKQNTGPLACKL